MQFVSRANYHTFAALQYHPGWAMAHEIPVLSAGLHTPTTGAMGSGIFDGKSGILNYVFDPNSGTRIIGSRISSNVKEPNEEMDADSSKRLIYKQDLSKFSWKVLESGSRTCKLDLEHGSTCSVTYELDKSEEWGDDGSYVFLALHGTRTYGASTFKAGIFSCGVVYFKTVPTFAAGLLVVEVPSQGNCRL
jgi:hypothetical protein